MSVKTIGIVGARGHTGAELIRLIAGHPALRLAFVSSRELDGQRVLLVTHGGVMRLLLARARNLPENQLLQVEVGYGALHGLQVEPGLQLTEA